MKNAVVEIRDLAFAWPGHEVVLDLPALTISEGSGCSSRDRRVPASRPCSACWPGSRPPTTAPWRCWASRWPGSLAVPATTSGRPIWVTSSSSSICCRFIRAGQRHQRPHLLPEKRARLQGSPADEARRLLRELQLPEEALHRPVHALSIGQQQRVAAARALIGSPPLVIADEPTSALDTDNRAAFIKLLFEECDKQGSTLVFVSHDPYLEPLFPRVENLQQLNRRASC